MDFHRVPIFHSWLEFFLASGRFGFFASVVVVIVIVVVVVVVVVVVGT